MNPHFRKSPLTLAIALAACSSATAGTIVPDLDDSTAVYNSTTVGTTAVDSYSPVLANGVTLAARFTPSAADITNSATGAVAVIETGGTTSGTGIWILNGNLWFLTSSGSSTAVPSSSVDLSGAGNAIGLQLGPVAAGVQTSIFTSFDTAGARLVVGQDSVITAYSLTNITGTWNWTGNDTVGFGIADPTITTGNNFGWRGGLADLTGASLYNTNNAVSLAGTVDRGQVFNAVTSVPEPASLGLAATALLGAACLRRRPR